MTWIHPSERERLDAGKETKLGTGSTEKPKLHFHGEEVVWDKIPTWTPEKPSEAGWYRVLRLLGHHSGEHPDWWEGVVELDEEGCWQCMSFETIFPDPRYEDDIWLWDHRPISFLPVPEGE